MLFKAPGRGALLYVPGGRLFVAVDGQFLSADRSLPQQRPIACEGAEGQHAVLSRALDGQRSKVSLLDERAVHSIGVLVRGGGTGREGRICEFVEGVEIVWLMAQELGHVPIAGEEHHALNFSLLKRI